VRAVLVVEDEPSLRRVVARVLMRPGLEVVTAACGAEALELPRSLLGRGVLLIADMAMPGGVGGRELDLQLGKRSPQLNPTAYPRLGVGRRRPVLGPVLAKPYDTVALSDVARKALAG